VTAAARGVIVVEDDPGVQRALARLLTLAGFQPRLYGCAEELLAGPVPEATCMIVDIQLPGENGLALVERLLDAGPLPPVIFITASDDPEFREWAARLGAGFLNQPFHAAQLMEMLRVMSPPKVRVSG